MYIYFTRTLHVIRLITRTLNFHQANYVETNCKRVMRAGALVHRVLRRAG